MPPAGSRLEFAAAAGDRGPTATRPSTTVITAASGLQTDIELSSDIEHLGCAGQHPERTLRIVSHLEIRLARLEGDEPFRGAQPHGDRGVGVEVQDRIIGQPMCLLLAVPAREMKRRRRLRGRLPRRLDSKCPPRQAATDRSLPMVRPRHRREPPAAARGLRHRRTGDPMRRRLLAGCRARARRDESVEAASSAQASRRSRATAATPRYSSTCTGETFSQAAKVSRSRAESSARFATNQSAACWVTRSCTCRSLRSSPYPSRAMRRRQCTIAWLRYFLTIFAEIPSRWPISS